MQSPIEKKVTNKSAAEQLSVGRGTITAVRKMLGIPPTVRKVFASDCHRFLKTYPDFQIADADRMELFAKRHPEFKLPVEVLVA